MLVMGELLLKNGLMVKEVDGRILGRKHVAERTS